MILLPSDDGRYTRDKAYDLRTSVAIFG